jgi:hypothetical protein
VLRAAEVATLLRPQTLDRHLAKEVAAVVAGVLATVAAAVAVVVVVAAGAARLQLRRSAMLNLRHIASRPMITSPAPTPHSR